jgi:NAD(P)-dependent dehydrogenase (short-subunit alcohol dehydrogenase family)
MSNLFISPNENPKTVIVTGGAGDIGAQTIRSYHSAGCNVVIADLFFARDAAEKLISELSDSHRAVFHPADITNWSDMQSLFRETRKRFGQVDIVIANAGMMESKGFFDFEEDDAGDLREPTEAYKVIDVNLKGTMNSKLTTSRIVLTT